MDKIKNYLIIGLFCVIGVLLLLKQCNAPKSIKSVPNDTIIHIDTIKMPYKVVEFKTKYVLKHDSSFIHDVIQERLCDYNRIYNDSTVDSNITIFTNIATTGVIDSMKIKYRLKVPMKIIETRDFHDTKIESNKWDLNLGAEVGGNQNSFSTSVYTSIRIKDVSYGYRYDLIDKTHNITIGYRIFKSKK